jgi:pimeloyl-ACP methyl ester carboxylesterase
VFVRRYYRDHPDGVIGIVFVDSSHEQQVRRLGEPGDAEQNRRDALRQLDLCRALAWSGAVRLSGAMQQIVAAQHLPDDLAAEVVAMANRTHYCAGVAHEMQGFASDIEQTEPPASLGDLPLVVLTRGLPSSPKDFPMPVSLESLDRMDRNWMTLQNELTALSSRASHRVVSGSGHAIPLQAPDAVVTAVRDIIDGRIE